ncbi:MAG: hypothetical protein ACREEW_13375, partial [Caulobacteraceae bacterium]
ADAIWWSFPLGTLTSSSLTALYYRFGRWREVRMLRHQPSSPVAADSATAPPAMDAEEPDVMAGEILAS